MLEHIFVICSTEFEPDRVNYLKNYFSNNNLKVPITFVEALYKNRDEGKIPINKYGNTLTTGEKCLTQNFINLFGNILSTYNYEYVLVLESDVIFTDNFLEEMNRVINDYKTIKKDNDMIFFGNACNFKPNPQNHKIGRLFLQNVSNCMDSMLISRNAMKNIYDYLLKVFIDKPVDHLLNDIIRERHINAYWCIPHLIIQGSATGIYTPMVKNR